MRETSKNQPADDRTSGGGDELGGADAVEKTTYVVGAGTDPRARRGDAPSAIVSSRAPAAIVGVIAVLVVLVIIAYFIGLGGR